MNIHSSGMIDNFQLLRFGIYHYIAGVDIFVDDIFSVNFVKTVGDLDGKRQKLLYGQRIRHELTEGLGPEIFQNNDE